VLAQQVIEDSGHGVLLVVNDEWNGHALPSRVIARIYRAKCAINFLVLVGCFHPCWRGSSLMQPQHNVKYREAGLVSMYLLCRM